MNTYTHYKADELATLRISPTPPNTNLGGSQVSWCNLAATTYDTAVTAQIIADEWTMVARQLRHREATA